MGVDQRIVAGSNPGISRVVSKPDRDHGTATTDNRNLGLTPAGTISHSYLCLDLYPIQLQEPLITTLIGDSRQISRQKSSNVKALFKSKTNLPQQDLQKPVSYNVQGFSLRTGLKSYKIS